MNASQLLEHFHHIGDAPDAVPRLRRFILDLAVRGKLVPQDRNDEPASELLKRIAKEKARLLKAGEIRKEKLLPEIEPDEIPFEAPHGWEWVRIRKVTSDRGQMVPDRDFTYIDVTAINKEVGRIEDAKVTSAKEAPSRARKIVRKGDVLYSCVRPYLLNIAIVEIEILPSPIASTAFAILNGFGLVLPRYQWIVLRSPFMVARVEEKMRGQAYPAINDSDFALLPFPLPPLAEQHHIVAKVDELMALSDQLEAARDERETTRDRLTAGSLARLNVPDSETFQDDARFALDALPVLTTRHDQIKQFRQTILNLAVRGKLMEQDPNDEPASELLKRIAKERAGPQAIKKARRNGETEISRLRADTPLPMGWRWTNIDEIALSMRYGTSTKCEYAAPGVPVLRIPNVSGGFVSLDDIKSGPLTEGEIRDLALSAGDLLLIRSNGSLDIVGRSAIVTVEAEGMAFAGYLVRLRLSLSNMNPKYVWLALNSTDVRDQIERPIRSAVGLKNVNLTEFGSLTFPLPPLAEQHRIVAKADALMALCDRLETSLIATAATRRRLLDSLLAGALAPYEVQEQAA